jgi:hypothetical protein
LLPSAQAIRAAIRSTGANAHPFPTLHAETRTPASSELAFGLNATPMAAADSSRGTRERTLLPFRHLIADRATVTAPAMAEATEETLANAARNATAEGVGSVRVLFGLSGPVALPLVPSEPSAKGPIQQNAIDFPVQISLAWAWDWLAGVADRLAPRLTPEYAARAFEAFGKEGMPAWAAKREADALATVVGSANGAGALVAEKARARGAKAAKAARL